MNVLKIIESPFNAENFTISYRSIQLIIIKKKYHKAGFLLLPYLKTFKSFRSYRELNLIGTNSFSFKRVTIIKFKEF